MYNPIVFKCAKTIEGKIKPILELRNCVPFEAIGECAGNFYLSFCLIFDAPNRADVYLGTRIGKSIGGAVVMKLAALGKKLHLDIRKATDRFAGGADIEEARLHGIPAFQFAVNEKALGKMSEYAGAAIDLLISKIAPSEIAAFNRKLIQNSLAALEKDAKALLETQKGGARLQALMDEIAEEKRAAAEAPVMKIDLHLAKVSEMRKSLASLQAQAREKEFRGERQRLEEERRRITADLADLEKMRGSMDPDIYGAEKEGLEFMLREVERIIVEKKKQ